jgi:hypothetical protein
MDAILEERLLQLQQAQQAIEQPTTVSSNSGPSSSNSGSSFKMFKQSVLSNTVLIGIIVVPVVLFIFLYFTKFGFVKKTDELSGESHVSVKKVSLYTLLGTGIIIGGYAGYRWYYSRL